MRQNVGRYGTHAEKLESPKQTHTPPNKTVDKLDSATSWVNSSAVVGGNWPDGAVTSDCSVSRSSDRPDRNAVGVPDGLCLY